MKKFLIIVFSIIIFIYVVIPLFRYVLFPIFSYVFMGLGIFLSIAAVGGLCFGIYIGVRNYWLAIQSNITNKPLRVSMMSILFLSMAYFIMVVLFVAWVLYMINTSAPLTGFMN